MNNNIGLRSKSFFYRIGLVIFLFVSIVAILFIFITYQTLDTFNNASTQILNRGVANNIAQSTSNYSRDEFNFRKADSIFRQIMVISPNTEAYFLDKAGNVKYYHAEDSAIKEKKVSIKLIETYLNDNSELIKNIDPREPGVPKIFSAAPVVIKGQKIGYIYVVLGSTEYRGVADTIFKSQLWKWLIITFIMILLSTLFFCFFYVSRLQNRYNQVVYILNQFREGNLSIRFKTKRKDEFFPIADAFNKMVDLLNKNFDDLKASEEQRKNFLANISHDLRTPLAVARGYAETLLMTSEDDYLKIIYDKILKVEKFVLQLFELSRMDTVNFSPHKEAFTFSEILQENIQSSKLLLEEKNIDVACINCEDTTLVFADISMMERLIQNLLENAIKYTQKGGAIKFELKRSHKKLIFILSNTAAISVEMLKWINNQDNEVLGRPKDAGLGLALVKKIAKLHGFEFYAELKEKETIFTLQLQESYIFGN